MINYTKENITRARNNTKFVLGNSKVTFKMKKKTLQEAEVGYGLAASLKFVSLNICLPTISSPINGVKTKKTLSHLTFFLIALNYVKKCCYLVFNGELFNSRTWVVPKSTILQNCVIFIYVALVVIVVVILFLAISEAVFPPC